ncbi:MULTISPECIES: 2Fe-2S iron-sulfur cluster-binding protein [Pseudoalteromonas]|uniref:2Fe-2S iron-sulfur cluster-binding protein n=1 Tax=Pseudoalteromonas obscura TaxID=3048491 RepID=A0ABT7EJX7_9GAMM|nr:MULTISPECIES: 2Fe-2S iron-sulfur cluster-binding protein [Pseudoalteromonas]MBQ4836927.1 2Fe-2S iron-sulfur cluster binding domain-containing protein [Pseudoalteromonas luteoviolacea]MDK2595359.1 2Fe-2S iron-sulfur cluster-binding protein [Pseudoalteromonas sp. P94(2023)]
MPEITFIDFAGNETKVDVPNGTSLMQAAMENMVEGIEAECGGSGSCATCHCYLTTDWQGKIAGPNSNESDMLELVSDPKDLSRLSCQVTVSDEHHGLQVHLPQSQY